MRHGTRSQRLSRPSEARAALLDGLVRGLIVHGRITTTHARAKEAQRLADRLIAWGKEGSIASRRRAFRVLQDRTLVKRLFADVAPQFVELTGGYTRVIHLSQRRGDGAQEALLALSRLPAAPQPAVTPPPKAQPPPKVPTPPQRGGPEKAKPVAETPKPKGLFQGLRRLWTRKAPG